MAEKVTQMLLKVDLDCYSCYKKIKKTLCKFPQIRDQIYDEKNNTVKITVVCCSPEKIRDKLCCRGGSSIKSIEILEPSKPKAEKQEPEKPKQKEPDQKPKQPEKPKEAEKPKDNGKPKVVTFIEKPKEADKPKDSGKPKDADKPKEAEKPKPKPKEADKPPQPAPQPVVLMPVQPPAQPVQPPAQPVPTMMTTQACPMDYYSSCGQCYGGGCPCCRHLYGMPAAPPPYDNRGNVYGYPYGNGGGGGGNGGYYGYNTVQRCNLDRCCDYYLNEENPNSSCAIM